MQLFAYLIAGAFATWLLTWSMIMEDVEGPFALYSHIRNLANRPWVPALIRKNRFCPVCISWWAGALVALCLPVYGGLNWLQCALLYFVLVYAFSGAVVFWYRYIRSVFSINANEF